MKQGDFNQLMALMPLIQGVDLTDKLTTIDMHCCPDCVGMAYLTISSSDIKDSGGKRVAETKKLIENVAISRERADKLIANWENVKVIDDD